MKLPAFQFYPADWLNDINLKLATYEEKGFLIDLMCVLHQSPKYGYLTKEMEDNLHQLLGKDRRTSARLLAKVRQKSLMNVDSQTGELFNKRMVKDNHIRQVRKDAGKLGGNPDLLKQKVNQSFKQKTTPSSSSSSSSSSSEREHARAEEINLFFSDEKTRNRMLEKLFPGQKNNPKFKKEIVKFVAYWTEPNKDGTQKWEKQSSFGVENKLISWLSRIEDFESPDKSNITFIS